MEVERRFMPLVFVLAGTFNVLMIKWTDNILTESSDGKLRSFQHPLIQTAFMFLGEFLCFIVFKIIYFLLQRRQDGSENSHGLTRGGRELTPLSLLFPSFLDAISSILLFTGLYLTYTSSFQILRAAAIIFVAIFSSIHLDQRLTFRHWMAIFTISCGIIVVVSIDFERVFYDQSSLPHTNANSILTGNLLIILSQVFQGLQFVYEEKHLKGNDIPPMQAVGWQGLFGLCITVLMGLILNFIPMPYSPFGDNPRGVFDDIHDGFYQLHNSGTLITIMCLFILSSAIYNFSIRSMMKFSSSANCLIADGLRAILVWWFAIVLDWEYINLVTLMGFLIITMGAVSYRNATFLEWYRTIMSRIARHRYANMNASDENGEGVPTSRPADII